jgi:hypothetical protein
MSIYPTPDLVAVTWLKSVAGLPTNQIATTLPADNSSWATSGFVQVTAIGGNPGREVPFWQPAIQIDCWANNPNSQKPPWGKAGHLAATIQWATYGARQPGVLALGGTFHPTRLMSVYPLTEPRRILSDEAGFARVQIDLLMTWTIQEVV